VGMSLIEKAQAYLSAGLCALPAIKAEKRPAVGRWKQYQQRMPTQAEMSAWAANNPDAVCILCGCASHNTEIIDFDAGGELFLAWLERIPTNLRDRLIVERTPSGGWHVIYRCLCAICGNLKLAQRKVGDKIITLIETRGEGGLFLCAPTPGYEITQGDLCNLPILTEAERDLLLQAAWQLSEYVPHVVNRPTISADISHICSMSTDNLHKYNCATDNPNNVPISDDNSHNTDRPGDDFNNRGDVRVMLEQHGWVRITDHKGTDGNEYWRRPGKKSGWSATLKDRVFYVFSSNASPFDPNQSYSPFSVYTLLNHSGDFEQAARCLREDGYGGDGLTDQANGVDISGIVNQSSGTLPKIPTYPSNASDTGPTIQRLSTLIENFEGLNPPVIHGLLREGETMNVIASPKIGKSWFVSTLAIAIASGLDWLGLKVESGRVLHIDNELHSCTSTYRYRVITEAMGMPHHLYSDNIDVISLRGQLRDLYSLGSLFNTIESGQYKLVIIDAFYRTLPCDTDENDNGAIANLYNHIDHYAAQLKCAFVLIHHTSKGNQSGKAVTDVGAGAGSQSRAADTHLVLRQHEDDDIVVLESAVRSWPPMQPKGLLWQWPLFVPCETVDTSALLGAVKPKPKSKEVDLADFVEQCIAINDPCSKRSVCYEAGQRFGLSERKAEEILDLAMERDLASRIRVGSSMRYVQNRPGVSGDKAQWTAALLAHDPNGNVSEIAKKVGVSERYVRQIRNENKGLTAELRMEPTELSSGSGRN